MMLDRFYGDKRSFHSADQTPDTARGEGHKTRSTLLRLKIPYKHSQIEKRKQQASIVDPCELMRRLKHKKKQIKTSAEVGKEPKIQKHPPGSN